MGLVDTLFGIAGLGSTVANVAMLKRFIGKVMLIVALTAISGTMAGALIIGGFYGLYIGLIDYGVPQPTVAIVVGGSVFAVTLITAGAAMMGWRGLRRLPGGVVQDDQISIGSRIGSIADAFLDGLLTERQK